MANHSLALFTLKLQRRSHKLSYILMTTFVFFISFFPFCPFLSLYIAFLFLKREMQPSSQRLIIKYDTLYWSFKTWKDVVFFIFQCKIKTNILSFAPLLGYHNLFLAVNFSIFRLFVSKKTLVRRAFNFWIR